MMNKNKKNFLKIFSLFERALPKGKGFQPFKNKKAWIRIVEATIAIMLIASVLFVMIARIPERTENNIYETERFILEQISKNDSLRTAITSYDTVTNPPPAGNTVTINSVEKEIRNMIPPYLAFDIRICEVETACGILKYPTGAEKKEIYSDEVLITSTLNQYQPKKLRLFVWKP